MKKMVEMNCCDVCGKPLYMSPEDIEGYAFKNGNGQQFDAVLCEDCLDGKVFECAVAVAICAMKMLSMWIATITVSSVLKNCLKISARKSKTLRMI